MNSPATAGVRRSLLPVVLVAVAGVAASTILWLRERDHIRRDEAQELAVFTTRITDEFRVRIVQIESALHGLRGLYTAQGGLDGPSWEAYLRQLNTSPLPGLEGFAYVRRVPDDRLPDFLAEARRRFDPRFPDTIVSNSSRELALLALQQPADGQPSKPGADYTTLAGWIDHASLARRTGTITLSPPTTVENDQDALQLFVTAPLYEIGAPTGTEAARFASHHGWLTANLRADPLFKSIQGLSQGTARFEVTDIAPDGGATRLYLSTGVDYDARKTSTQSVAVPLLNRTWRLDLATLPGDQTRNREVLATRLFAAGLAATGLLVGTNF